MILLPDRAVLKAGGRDVTKFLQGCISNDIYSIEDGWLYTMFLNPQGRVLYDAFILKDGENSFAIDHPSKYTNFMLENFEKSRFRAKVEFQPYSRRVFIDTIHGFPDPRNTKLGNRILAESHAENFSENAQEYLKKYHKNRIMMCIPDFEMDMFHEVSMPLDYRIDLLNGISFNKGCYCGQEAISKARNIVGRVRDIRIIKTENNKLIPPKGTTINNNGVPIGKVCGSVDNIGIGVFNINKLVDTAEADGTVLDIQLV